MPASSLFTSKTGEHFTPADIAERARYVFGGSIDLDPASSWRANQTIRAARYYADQFCFSEDDQRHIADRCFIGYDGLRHPQTLEPRVWTCRSLWLNPPFSRTKRDANGAPVLNGNDKEIRERIIDEWVTRWCEAIDTRAAAQGLLLTPARVDTQWFQGLWGRSMCFIYGRLTFGDADNGAPFPTVITYTGPNADRFYQIFDEIGECGIFSRS